MRPIEVFNSGRERAEHLLRLHALLCNTRQRGTRQDWARNFKRIMHWPQGEQIHRVDGRQAILVLRQKSGMTPAHFSEDNLSELLRAALAGIVSALDRYCHDLVVSRIVAALGKPSRKINRELRMFRIPIIRARDAIRHAGVRKGKGGRVRPRPMNIIRHAVQDVLYRDETFQRPDDIVRGLKMVGIEDLWQRCAEHMQCTPEKIIQRLNQIVDRRNRIVHEGDVVRRRRGGRLALHPISRNQVEQDIQWITTLANSIETVVS
jgi:hypothetical protein